MNLLRTLVMTSSLLLPAAPAATHLMYVGTYTGGGSEGIYAYRYDEKSGAVEPLGLAAKSEDPTFLAVHPGGKFLYAANETGRWQGKDGGHVTAFAIDASTGKLRELSQQSTVGGGPCHLVVDPGGRNLLAANYGGGSVVSLPIAPDGSVGPHTFFSQHTGGSVNPGRQKEPHAHSVNVAPGGRHAFVADLGTDRLHAYACDPAKGMLRALPGLDARLAPGSGPRHLAFSPDGRHAYVINELLSTLTAFAFDDAGGKLSEIGTVSTLPPGFDGRGNSTAEVRVHPGGRFVFGSNRGHDSIAVFARDTTTGVLTPVEITRTGGRTPRNFNLDPAGGFLFAAGQDSHDVRQFRVDPASGRLASTGLKFGLHSPVCIRFVPIL